MRADVVLVGVGPKCDVAEVFLHGPDLLEEQLKGPHTQEEEVEGAVQERAGFGADFLADANERGFVVGLALSLVGLECMQGHLIRTGVRTVFARVGRDLGDVCWNEGKTKDLLAKLDRQILERWHVYER